MILLGVPSFGLTFAVTMISAFLPSVLQNLTDPLVIGLIIGAEGFFGMFLPIIMGNLADRSTKVRGRFKYLLPASSAMALALCLMGIIHLLGLIAAMVALFYIGYYAYLAPYWAIYPDLIPKSYSGRSRSAESAWRVVGALLALLSGGFLLSLWRPLPFLAAALAIGTVTMVLLVALRGHGARRVNAPHQTMRESFAYVGHTLRTNAGIRNLVIANALWNATLRSILVFTVLFFTAGLGRSHSFVSGVIFPIAAIGMLIMAPLSGKLADRYGHLKVLIIALLIYGIGDLVPGITQMTWVVVFIPLVSGAAATVMTLPYSVLMRLLHDEPHGAASGIFGLSRGIGSFAGPVLTGLAVEVGRPYFASTHGYAAFWWAAGIYILASLPFVWRMRMVSSEL